MGMMRGCPLAGVNPDIARILRKDRLCLEAEVASFTFAEMHNSRFCGDKLRGVAHASV